jgi:coenzyme F420-reducing hydrogenase beta subunit
MPEITKLTKYECTGCGACVNACPDQNIRFEYNDEGFLYPIIDKECSECGLCSTACPILTKKTEYIPEIAQYAVAAISRDKDIYQTSTSGGAFTEICRAFGEQDTAVFGAKFENLSVVHSSVIGVENTNPFRKSKYVQSETGKSFDVAKAFLEEKRRVVFSGTPCQIAGLRSFLGRDYENLLSIDFICHGVGSPKVFEAALLHLSSVHGSRVVDYSFRNQVVRFGNRQDFISKYAFADGRTVYDADEIYQNFFLSQLCLRASCGENCKFRNRNRVSDITIADFKGKLEIFPFMFDHRNYSTIIINSKKGNHIFGKLKQQMQILSCSLDDVERYNPLFFKTTKQNPDREEFFRMFIQGADFCHLANRFFPPRVAPRKYSWLKDYLKPFYLKRLYHICRRL